MNLPVIGGAGHVGTILRPALEAHHTCRYLDLKPIEEAGQRSLVGDVNDEGVLWRALQGIEAILWVAMGTRPGAGAESCYDTDAAFDVNVGGLYRTLTLARRAGITRFVYTSSMSVYRSMHDRTRQPVTEGYPPDAWSAYGVTKHLGEIIGRTWAAQEPGASFIGLRIVVPRTPEDWPGNSYVAGKSWSSMGPGDLRRLFLAALDANTPGAHIVQASGDLGGAACSHEKVFQLLGWLPVGE
jgi:nucleoside-diphosphate-sugar epimerase